MSLSLNSLADPMPATTDTQSIDIAAIFFPGYHRDPHYDSWFGEGWNEWKLMAEAKPRFPGQRLLASKWGAFDEAHPTSMTQQINLAADHGIDVFIFDWYWYSGVRILDRPLREGYLGASSRKRMKFALMWANHDWRNYFPAPLDHQPEMLLPMRHSAEDFQAVMKHCINLYFNQPEYWRIDNGLYFSFFQPELFIDQLGGPEKARAVLQAANEQVEKAGLGRMHFAAFAWVPGSVAKLKSAGFNSVTTYNVTGSGKTRIPDRPLDDYKDLMERHVNFWKEMDTGELPYAPVVTVGWDTTPRWVKDCPFPPPREEYPYGPVVINNTPQNFGDLCRTAIKHVNQAKIRPPAIVINAWNEWSEGSALLPDAHHGTAMLEAAKEAFEANGK